MVQFRVAASSAAWGWQSSESGATIPKSFGFEAATPYGATNNVTRNGRTARLIKNRNLPENCTWKTCTFAQFGAQDGGFPRQRKNFLSFFARILLGWLTVAGDTFMIRARWNFLSREHGDAWNSLICLARPVKKRSAIRRSEAA